MFWLLLIHEGLVRRPYTTATFLTFGENDMASLCITISVFITGQNAHTLHSPTQFCSKTKLNDEKKQWGPKHTNLDKHDWAEDSDRSDHDKQCATKTMMIQHQSKVGCMCDLTWIYISVHFQKDHRLSFQNSNRRSWQESAIKARKFVTMTNPPRSSLHHDKVVAGNGHRGNGSENTPLMETGGVLESYNNEQSESQEQAIQPKDYVVPSSFFTVVNISPILKSRLLLFFVAFLYGSLNVSLRMVYARPGPPAASVLSTTRGWLSVTCFLPFLFRMMMISSSSSTATSSSQDVVSSIEIASSPSVAISTATTAVNEGRDRKWMFWRFAFELALFNFGTQGLINLGLVTVESARAAFLTQLSVVITPIISALFGHEIGPKTWFACLLALIGIYVLSHTGHGGSLSMHLTVGDLCCIGGAVCWSYYIYRLSAWGDYFDDTLTQFVKNIMLASMYTIWMVLSLTVSSEGNLWEGSTDVTSWLILFYSALGPSAIADIIQQKAQSNIPAAESNVILSLEPVFTALLGLLLLGESLSWKELCGGGLILTASILASS